MAATRSMGERMGRKSKKISETLETAHQAKNQTGNQNEQQAEQLTGQQASPIVFDDLKKSNTLINAKGSATLLAQKIFVIGLRYVRFSDEHNCMMSTIYGEQIKQILGVEGHSLYGNIKDLAPSLTDWKIVYNDEEHEEFMIANIVQRAQFKDGKLIILYNSELSRYMGDVLANYTILPLEEIMSLRSRYSFRLYEILKSKLDYMRAIKKTRGSIPWEVDLTDLKLQIGIIDVGANKGIVKALKKSAPDYEGVEEMVNEPKYKTYNDFRRNVLEPSVEELNEKTNLVVSYEPVKQGRAVKIIRFIINSKSIASRKKDAHNTLEDDERLEAIAAARSILDKDLYKMSDVRKIAEAADYDVDKIRNAAACYDNASDIKNPVGWMISAVRAGYTSPVAGGRSHSSERNRTDYDVIEELVVEK